jgi:hypothetical protein
MSRNDDLKRYTDILGEIQKLEAEKEILREKLLSLGQPRHYRLHLHRDDSRAPAGPWNSQASRKPGLGHYRTDGDH